MARADRTASQQLSTRSTIYGLPIEGSSFASRAESGSRRDQRQREGGPVVRLPRRSHRSRLRRERRVPSVQWWIGLRGPPSVAGTASATRRSSTVALPVRVS